MEFKSGYSYFCKKSYGEDYYNKVNQMNQFLMYTQPKTRTRYGGVSYYDYNMEMTYYGYGNDEVYKTPVPRFTAGSIYRCHLGNTITDDRGLFISLNQIDPDDFMEIELNLGDSTKEIMSKLGTYGIGFEVLPEKVIGGDLKDGVIENPDLSITVFKVHVNRVGSFIRGGHLSTPPIIETKFVEAGDNLSDAIDKAVYDMWKKIRIQSAWCSAIRRTLNHRLSIEKGKNGVYTVNSSYISCFYT